MLDRVRGEFVQDHTDGRRLFGIDADAVESHLHLDFWRARSVQDRADLACEIGQIDVVRGRRAIELFVKGRDHLDPRLHLFQRLADRRFLGLAGLNAGQRRDRLERVLHPVVDFLAQRLGIGERLLQFHLCDHLIGQHDQGFALDIREFAGFDVDGAERAHDLTVRQAQGGAGIEPDAVRLGHQRIAGRSRVLRQVADFQQVVLEHHIGADRAFQRGLGLAEPLGGLEPLPVPVHQRHERGGDVQRTADEGGHAVEPRLGRGVEQAERAERGQPFLVMRRGRRQRGPVGHGGSDRPDTDFRYTLCAVVVPCNCEMRLRHRFACA